MTGVNFSSAIDDFRRARRQADLEQVLARLTGKSAELLSFEEVRQRLKGKESAARVLKEIPLDAIVGSVGRYADFTRSFLPRHDSDAERWSRVEMAVTDLKGLPPIMVYQVGQVYFVDDGHHRVSVARQLGATHIQAYVTEVHTKVPLSPADQPDDLILKAEYAEFLERTHLDTLRPQADLRVTAPGQYRLFQEQIQLRQHLLNETSRPVSFQEAAADWYDHVYLPVARVIRERGLLRDWPGRTEADLYAWLCEHRAALEQALGWDIKPEAAASDLVRRFSPTPKRVAARLSHKILSAVLPKELEAGPPPGEWRQERLAGRLADRMFSDILVPVSGQESGWQALEQALEIARREGARLHGLYVARSKAYLESPETQAIQSRFERRCELAHISGELTLEVGQVARKICEWARWTDLVVVHLAHPPAPRPGARLKSGFRNLLQWCPRPVLAVPRFSVALSRALLAYDGSPKADEALYVAAYLAGQWQTLLVVLTVAEAGRTAAAALQRAQAYLEARGVQAAYVQESGPVAEAVLAAAQARQSNLVIMGGYGFRPELQVVLGSSVDQVLRQSDQPVLICR